MLRSSIVGLAIGMTVLAASVEADAGLARVETQSYVLGSEAATVCGRPVGVGGNCFFVRPEDANVTISVRDDAGWPVGVMATFELSNGHTLGLVYCSAASPTVVIPQGTRQIWIYVHGVVADATGALGSPFGSPCPVGTGGPATHGKIVLTYDLREVAA